MPTDTNSNDYAPLFWYKRNPFYLTAFICLAMVIGMIAGVILDTANISSLGLLGFVPEEFLHGWIWQIFTYPFLDYPSFFFLFGVLFFFFAGNETEKYLGRKRFIHLLLMLWIIPPALMILWRNPHFPPFYFGGYDFSAALIISFATLYPNLEYWGWVPMKWVAAACLFLSSLSYLPKHNWQGLLILWGMCATSFAYIRWLQHGAELPKAFDIFKKLRPRPKFKVVPRDAPPSEDSLHESIDPLLEKISKHGLSSLTAKEKALLEKASASLQKKRE